LSDTSSRAAGEIASAALVAFPGRLGLIHFSANKRNYQAKLRQKTWTCPPLAALLGYGIPSFAVGRFQFATFQYQSCVEPVGASKHVGPVGKIDDQFQPLRIA